MVFLSCMYAVLYDMAQQILDLGYGGKQDTTNTYYKYDTLLYNTLRHTGIYLNCDIQSRPSSSIPIITSNLRVLTMVYTCCDNCYESYSPTIRLMHTDVHSREKVFFICRAEICQSFFSAVLVLLFMYLRSTYVLYCTRFNSSPTRSFFVKMCLVYRQQESNYIHQIIIGIQYTIYEQ